MSTVKEYRLNQLGVLINQKRIPLNSRQRAGVKKTYPYYGASGVVDYVEDYLFEGEHVLISEDGENLRSRNTPIAFKANGKFWVNNHAHIFKGNEDWINDFVVYYFMILNVNPYITGAVQPKLNKENLLSISIVMTNFNNIKKGVDILRSLDDKIELNRQMNQTLEEMAQAMFKHYFVDGVDRDNLPEGWRMGKLGDIMNVNTKSISKDYPHNTIYYYDTGSVTQNTFSQGIEIDITDAPSRAKRIVNHLDIIYSTVRPNQLHHGIVLNAPVHTVVSTGFAVLQPKTPATAFIYLLLTQNSVVEYLTSIAEASATTFPAFNPDILRMYELVIPSAAVVFEFEEKVMELYELADSNNKENTMLQNTRDYLLPKLISGEIIPAELNQLEQAL